MSMDRSQETSPFSGLYARSMPCTKEGSWAEPGAVCAGNSDRKIWNPDRAAGGRIEVAQGCLLGCRKTRGLKVPLISQTERDIFSVAEAHMKFKGLLFFLVFPAIAADLPGSQDPPLMKRYAGSEIIGYRSPKFDEYLMPLGKPKSKDAQPVWYFVFITAYKDGIIPDRLQGVVTKDRTLIHIAVMAPAKLEHNMEFVNAADMARALKESGKIALYGINFDTDKDTLRADSKAMLDEISHLLASDPQARLHVVGHTDNQGTPDHNLDLSRRRAAAVVRALTSQYGIASARPDSFGCGLYEIG